jgi:YVTN family beta-propeller protein
MRFIAVSAIVLICVSGACAQPGDRVYTAAQSSNTVSVIDPMSNKLLAAIQLGEDVPTA